MKAASRIPRYTRHRVRSRVVRSFASVRVGLLGVAALHGIGCGGSIEASEPLPLVTAASSRAGDERSATPAERPSSVAVTPGGGRSALGVPELEEFATAEVRAIAEAAAAAYTRDGTLCRTAVRVPLDLPRAGLPMPTQQSDFRGDARTGWPCLAYSPKSPYFRYSYRSMVEPSFHSLCTGDCGDVGAVASNPPVEPAGRFFEACAEADPTPGGGTLQVCWLGALRDDDTIKLGTHPVVQHEQP